MWYRIHMLHPLAAEEDSREKLRAAYLLVADDKFISPLVQGLSDGPLKEAREDLAYHLRSTILATSLPYLLTKHAVVTRRFQALLSAERIRALDPVAIVSQSDEALTPEAAEGAHKRASDALLNELSSDEGKDGFNHQIRLALRQHLNDDSVELASRELIHQGTLGVWTAFEVYLKAVAKTVVNQNPHRGLLLLSSEKTKAIFGTKGISANVLAEHAFDLTKTLGDAIFSSIKMDSMAATRAVYDVLFPMEEEISKSLNDSRLWLLNQRRHLLAHRRGIVDRQYLSNTGDSLPLGSRLSISAEDLLSYLETVRDVACVIARVVDEALPSD